ncbi:hypothetical protein AG1IA_07252 [Rhizoctonia solani AG-1 IA]|uniref:Uncharacterized protein n=1 Tax=Thanatephorus cucumeris (strain AG1-IA) TaxID=983506 RepID=L8WPK7_THACA|nr:hypothetical protein AG1IA_07252 [Rhizoctonia solani AG-1 IA]
MSFGHNYPPWNRCFALEHHLLATGDYMPGQYYHTHILRHMYHCAYSRTKHSKDTSNLNFHTPNNHSINQSRITTSQHNCENKDMKKKSKNGIQHDDDKGKRKRKLHNQTQ